MPDPSPTVPAPVSTTQRLLSCLEVFRGEEDGAVGHEDWAALAEIFARECKVIDRLALEADRVPPRELGRVRAVQARHAAIFRHLKHRQERLGAELNTLRQAQFRSQAVRGAYGQKSA